MTCKRLLAFTLVELLVVIAIVGLLSTIVLAVTSGVSGQGRIAKGLQFSRHLENSLGAYLVGKWFFDEGSGTTAYDASGWNNNGTLVGSPVWKCADTDTASGQGCSLEFNGSSNYITIINPTSLNSTSAITLEIWVKPQSMPNNNRVIYKGGWELLHWDAVFEDISGKGFQWNLPGANSGYWESRYNISYDSWYHVVFTYDSLSQKMKSYINGEVTREGTVSGLITVNSENLTIADIESGYRYKGLIDKIYVYEVALTAGQVQSQYYVGLNELLARGLISEIEYRRYLALS